MKDKLAVGMYVRYIPTIGEYTQKISKITKTKNCLLDMCYTLDDKEEVFSSHFDDILGASYNIIDLIEVGDYVNGEKVGYVDDCEGAMREYYYDYEDPSVDIGHLFEEIKSIVTKEQFEGAKYEIE